MTTWLDGIWQLFSVKSNECISCHSSIVSNGNIVQSHSSPAWSNPNLCSACSSEIPWITQIQCKHCGRSKICPDCSYVQESGLHCNRSAVLYEGKMKEWLAQLKYRGDMRYVSLLGSMLQIPFYQLSFENWSVEQDKINRELIQFQNFVRANSYQSLWDVITYVPISEERVYERGFNQAEQLARYLSYQYDIACLELLVRNRHSEKMSFQSKQKRHENVNALFSIHMRGFQELYFNMSINNKSPLNVLLVDDVYTTGSTMRACAEQLIHYLPPMSRIYGLSWGRS